jgi:branched-chain amino acid transport system substrate-binding protein
MRSKFIPALLLVFLLISCSPNVSENVIQSPEPADVPSPAPYQCTDPLGCHVIAPEQSIHIAWIQSTSGITAPLGQTNVNGAELALSEINFQLLGHPIQWDGQDSLCTAEGGQAAAEAIAADTTVVGVIGTTCTEEARTAIPLISAAGMVMISSSNLSPELTNPESENFSVGYFRTSPSFSAQAKVAAEFALTQLSLTTAATISDGSLYSEELVSTFAETFSSLGGSITGQENTTSSDPFMDQVLGRIAQNPPQLIYFPVSELDGKLIAAKKCGIFGLETTTLLSGDSLFTTSFPSSAGDCSSGMYLTGLNSATDAFLSSYSGKFGAEPATAYAPFSYDAVNLLLAAIEKVAIPDIDGSLYIPRQALRDALRATVSFPGITGELTCNEYGDCASKQAIAIFQVTQENVNGVTSLTDNSPVWTINK